MVTAFIPARGGSRTIPLKNIALLGGRPLIWWSIKALLDIRSADRIVVATDSEKIADVVQTLFHDAVEIYWRRPENATDSSTTESVLLEWLEYSQCLDTETILLVQATGF